jgi:hypothetical protein
MALHQGTYVTSNGDQTCDTSKPLGSCHAIKCSCGWQRAVADYTEAKALLAQHQHKEEQD